MSLKNLFQFLRRGMKRKSDVLYQTFLLFLLNPAPQIKIVKIMRPALPQIMQQIKIKIARSGLRKGHIKLSDGIFPRLAVDPGRILRCKLVAFPRITLHQRLADRVLTSRIRPRRIEVCKAGVHKQIHHLLCLLHIDRTVLLGQTHQPESQFFDLFT